MCKHKDAGPARFAENAELKQEIEFLGKGSAFAASSTRRGPLRVHRSGEGQPSNRRDVPDPEGVAGLVLPEANPGRVPRGRCATNS